MDCHDGRVVVFAAWLFGLPLAACALVLVTWWLLLITSGDGIIPIGKPASGSQAHLLPNPSEIPATSP